MDKEEMQEIMRVVSDCYRRISGETDFKEKMEKVREQYALLTDPNADQYGYPLLFYAAERGDYIGVEVLLKAGADATYQNENKYTPLHRLAYKDERDYAPWADERKVVELLLDAGTSAIRKDVDDSTCAYIAAGCGKFRILQALAEAGKKMDITCRNGRIPLHEACNYSKNAASSFFEYAKPKYDEIMAQESDGNEFNDRMLADRKKSQQEQYDKDKAKMDSYFESVKCLLDAGMDPDQKDDYGETAKSISLECKDIRISALLNGIYSEDSSGDNDLKMKSKGMTLMQAVVLKEYDAAAALLELGADANELSGDDKRYDGIEVQGKTPLSIACFLLDMKLISMLLQHGADPNFKDTKGQIPILNCLFSHNATKQIFENKVIENILKEMTEKGLNVNQEADEKGNTLLNMACYRAVSPLESKFVQQLLRYKADLNIANNDGVTPLMHICISDRDIIEDLQITLLEAGADVSAKDKKGNTPLMYAAQNRSKSMAKNLADMLFEFGNPLPDAVNNDGKSALEFAVEADNENLVNFLLSKT